MTKKVTRHIKVEERIAAALADLLPQGVRDDLRRRKVPAKQVISLFELDHNRFHVWADDVCDDPAEINLWHNLTWLSVGVHREKTKIDQGKIAKARRYSKKVALAEAKAKVRDILTTTKPKAQKPTARFKRKMNGRVVAIDVKRS